MDITKDSVEDRISKTMVGRESQLDTFKKQFDRVLEGGMGLSIISGQPGIGKSFFVERAVASLSGTHATYIHGKFRQYDSSPLIAFSEIIEQVTKHILTLPTDALKTIKQELSRRIGTDTRLISSLCPSAGILFEAHASRSNNPEQMKYKVRKAVYQFITTITASLFPLVIFIDDLQWADALSVSIIEAFCQDYEYLNLHLILSYREDGSGSFYLNRVKLPEGDDIRIPLSGLKPPDISDYICQVFMQNLDNPDYLVRALFGLSLGNPFNVSRVLRLFLQEESITYTASTGRWHICGDKLDSLSLPADIEALLTRQLDALSCEEGELLRLIMCASQASAELLLALTGVDKNTLETHLENLCKSGLLGNTGGGASVSYVISHDILLRLIHNRASDEDMSEIHYRIAAALYARQASPSRTAYHLMRSDLDRLRGSGAEKWLEILFAAGIQAKQGAAGAELALELFERCAALRQTFSNETSIETDFKISLELSECRYLSGDETAAKNEFEVMLHTYTEISRQTLIRKRYIKLCAMSGDFETVIALGFSLLAQQGFKLDVKTLPTLLVKAKARFTSARINRLAGQPDTTDEKIFGVLDTLSIMAPAAERTSDSLSTAIAVNMALLCARYGNSDYSPIAYATYAYILFSVHKDSKKGAALERVVLSLAEKRESADTRVAALTILSSLVHHRTNPLAETLVLLDRAVDEGEKSGSLYGSYAITFSILTQYMMGYPLDAIASYIGSCRQKQQRLEHYLTTRFYDLFDGHIRALKGGTAMHPYATNGSGAEGGKEIFAETISLNGSIIALQRLYLEGKTAEAYRLANDISDEVRHHEGFVLNAAFYLFGVLARCCRHSALSRKDQRTNEKHIRRELQALRDMTCVYPGTHRARLLLAQAEAEALLQPEKASDKPYREAMTLAGRQGNLPLEALAHLLAARFHSDDLKLSRFYASEAVRLYRKWGAAHIADTVSASFALYSEAAAAPQAAVAFSAPEPETDAAPVILFHLNKIETLTEDEGYLYLLQLLAEQSAADYCAVFTEKSDDMYLKYDIRRGGSACAHDTPVSMNHIVALPHKVLRYVSRTEEEIICADGSALGIFSGDQYLSGKDRPSFLCLPIKYAGVLIGMIYAEKSGGGFRESVPGLIKAVLSSLVSKQTIVRALNIRALLSPKNDASILTDRELEVLALVSKGFSNADISGALHITLGTVKNYLSIIYQKLETDNRIKAVMKAKELHIIPQ